NEGIELVKDTEVAESEGRHTAQRAEKQSEIYNLDLDHSLKVLSIQEDDSEVQEVVEVVTTAKLITETNIADLSKHTTRYNSLVLTQKVFANMRRVGKGFSEVETPLFENMLAVRDVDEEEKAQVPAQGDEVLELAVEEVANDVIPPTPTSPSPSSPVLDTCSALAYRVEVLENDKVVAASTPIPAAKPKILKIAVAPVVSTRRKKGVVIRDPEEELHSDTLAETPTVKDKGKGILIEAPKPMKKKDQYIKRYHGIKKKPQSESEARKNMISYLKNTKGYKMEFLKGKTYDEILPIFQARFDANMKFLFKSKKEIEKEDEEIIKSINEKHVQKAAKKRKLSEEAQKADDLKKRLEIVQDKDDDVFFEATPLAQKVHVVDYQVVVIDNKPKYKIIRADDTHQFYISFITLLKNFDKEDLETFWRIVRDVFSTSKPTNFSDEYLLLTLKTMFGELYEQDPIWRNQKSVHVQLFLLVERRYPLSRFTLAQLVNVARLQVEEESEISLELLSAANEELTAAKHKLVPLI
nr:hypothetical protein [Tanacetum cinerariifolium]